MKKQIKKADLILIASLFVIAVIALGVRIYTQNIKHPELEILVNSQYYGTYSLSKDQTIEIGETNVCEIKDGQVRMIDATCPDHLCMEFNAIDKNGGNIICLPNQVILHIVNAELPEDAVDTVAE